MLLNLLRGAGLDGLAGYRPERRPIRAAPPPRDPGAVRRRSASQPVHDPSNDDPAFRRNRVRHELLPLLDAIAERDVVPVLARQADLLRADAALLEAAGSLALDPTDAKALAAAPEPLARARGARAGCAPVTSSTRPTPATVARVLAVARGEAVACDVGRAARSVRVPAAAAQLTCRDLAHAGRVRCSRGL